MNDNLENKTNQEEFTPRFTVSKETQTLLESLRLLSNHWEEVHNALALIYGDKQAEEMMNEKYSDAYDKLEGVVYGFVCDSIREGLFSKESTTI